MKKTNRKGLTRARWIEVITAVLKVVGIQTPKIQFEPEGIMVEGWLEITFAEWEQENPSISKEKVLIRGYELVEWRSTGGSYHEPPDVYDTPRGTFQKPYDIICEIAKIIFENNLYNVIEGFQMDDMQKEEAKYVQQMLENPPEEEGEHREPPPGAEDAYRDSLERHNRQVLSRL